MSFMSYTGSPWKPGTIFSVRTPTRPIFFIFFSIFAYRRGVTQLRYKGIMKQLLYYISVATNCGKYQSSVRAGKRDLQSCLVVKGVEKQEIYYVLSPAPNGNHLASHTVGTYGGYLWLGCGVKSRFKQSNVMWSTHIHNYLTLLCRACMYFVGYDRGSVFAHSCSLYSLH